MQGHTEEENITLWEESDEDGIMMLEEFGHSEEEGVASLEEERILLAGSPVEDHALSEEDTDAAPCAVQVAECDIADLY